MENKLFEDRSKYKYMIFKLGAEVYGTPLLQVREVIENKTPKPVPGTPPAVEGVINLRGEVISVIDLRKLLKIEPMQSLSILVFDSDQGTMGAVVDRCISVTEIFEKDIDQKNSFSKGSAANYFIGIGKTEMGLITLINLSVATRPQN